MKGFTLTKWTDHEFAAYLRRSHAIDHYGAVGKAVMWRRPDDTCVAVAIYDNAKSNRRIWIPDWAAATKDQYYEGS